jgi:hypothetical protein
MSNTKLKSCNGTEVVCTSDGNIYQADISKNTYGSYITEIFFTKVPSIFLKLETGTEGKKMNFGEFQKRIL